MPTVESIAQLQIEDYFIETFAEKIALIPTSNSDDLLGFLRQFSPTQGHKIRLDKLMGTAIRNGYVHTALKLETPLRQILEKDLQNGRIDFVEYFSQNQILSLQVASLKKTLQ